MQRRTPAQRSDADAAAIHRICRLRCRAKRRKAAPGGRNGVAPALR